MIYVTSMIRVSCGLASCIAVAACVQAVAEGETPMCLVHHRKMVQRIGPAPAQAVHRAPHAVPREHQTETGRQEDREQDHLPAALRE
jgi:hypothetical protein